MNYNYISTESLYDSGAHLSHARQYSHKYIKREPDGKGGYRYWYQTDRSSGSGPAFDTYVREKGEAFASRNANYNDAYATFQPTAGRGSYAKSRMRTAKDYRQADKASQIYREGQSQNAKNYQSRVNQASKKTKPKVSKEYQEELASNSKENVYPETRINETIIPEKRIYENIIAETDQLKTPKNSSKTIGDYAKQAINSISTAAGSAYDKGTSFLKDLFSQPIITTEKKWSINNEPVKQETISGRSKSRK